MRCITCKRVTRSICMFVKCGFNLKALKQSCNSVQICNITQLFLDNCHVCNVKMERLLEMQQLPLPASNVCGTDMPFSKTWILKVKKSVYMTLSPSAELYHWSFSQHSNVALFISNNKLVLNTHACIYMDTITYTQTQTHTHKHRRPRNKVPD